MDMIFLSFDTEDTVQDAQYIDIYAYISHWSLWLLLHKFENTAFPVPYLNSFSLRAFITIWHAFLAIFIHLNIFIHVRFILRSNKKLLLRRLSNMWFLCSNRASFHNTHHVNDSKKYSCVEHRENEMRFKHTVRFLTDSNK